MSLMTLKKQKNFDEKMYSLLKSGIVVCIGGVCSYQELQVSPGLREKRRMMISMIATGSPGRSWEMSGGRKILKENHLLPLYRFLVFYLPMYTS